MKQRILYRCDHCEFKGYNQDEVREHEDNCLRNLNLKNCMTCRFPWNFICEEVTPAVKTTDELMKEMDPCPHWVLSKHVEQDEDKLWELRSDDDY